MQAGKVTTGKSATEILKIGVGLLEVKIGKEQELRDLGYKQGFKKAQGLYMVSYPCAKCGKLLLVATPEAKRAASSYMMEAGWGHVDCNQA